MRFLLFILAFQLSLTLSSQIISDSTISIELYSANGIIREKMEIIKSDSSLKNGLYEYYYKNQLLHKGFYKNNHRDSIWTFYHYNKNIISHFGNFEKDSAIGKWIYYDTTGKVIFSNDIELIYSPIEQKELNDSLGIDHICLVEKSPEFPGGINEMNSFLAVLCSDLNTKIAGKVIDEYINGKIYISFVIDWFGTPNSFKVLRGINAEIDKLALESIQKLPRFTPLVSHGRPVLVKFTLPVQIKLN